MDVEWEVPRAPQIAAQTRRASIPAARVRTSPPAAQCPRPTAARGTLLQPLPSGEGGFHGLPLHRLRIAGRPPPQRNHPRPGSYSTTATCEKPFSYPADLLYLGSYLVRTETYDHVGSPGDATVSAAKTTRQQQAETKTQVAPSGGVGAAKVPDGHPGAGRDPPAAVCREGRPDAGLRRRRLRQDAAWPWSSSSAAPRSSTSRASSWPSRRPAEELTQNVALARLRPRRPGRRKKLALDYVRVERSEIEETGEYDLEGLVHPPRPRHRLHRRQARRAGHHRVAVRRPVQRRPSCGPNCAGCSAGSRTRASPPSSPASGARARSPATAWRNTSPTA